MIGASIGKNSALLAIFAVVTTALIAATWLGTRDQIEANERAFRERSLLEVVSAERHNNSMLEDSFTVEDAESLGLRGAKTAYLARMDGRPVAVIIPATARDGYTGDIDMIIGINVDGTISGVRVLNHRETPGLGDKVDYRKSQWVDSFSGKSLKNPMPDLWAVKKDKGVFDQFTGATITPRAVVKTVKQSLEFFEANRAELLTLAPRADNANDGESADG